MCQEKQTQPTEKLSHCKYNSKHQQILTDVPLLTSAFTPVLGESVE